jgi:hypothetical protein
MAGLGIPAAKEINMTSSNPSNWKLKAEQAIKSTAAREKMIKSLYDFLEAMKKWDRPLEWIELPGEFIGNTIHFERYGIPFLLAYAVGLECEHARRYLTEMKHDEDQLSESLENYLDDEGFQSDNIINLVNKDLLPTPLLEALNSTLSAYYHLNDILGQERSRHYLYDSIHAVNPKHFSSRFDGWLELTKMFIYSQKRYWTHVYPAETSGNQKNYSLIVNRRPTPGEDECEFLEHTNLSITVLQGSNPVAKAEFILETARASAFFPLLDSETVNMPREKTLKTFDPSGAANFLSSSSYIECKGAVNEEWENAAYNFLNQLRGEQEDVPSPWDLLLEDSDGNNVPNGLLHFTDLSLIEGDLTPQEAVNLTLRAALDASTRSDLGHSLPLSNAFEDVINGKAQTDPSVFWGSLCETVLMGLSSQLPRPKGTGFPANISNEKTQDWIEKYLPENFPVSFVPTSDQEISDEA